MINRYYVDIDEAIIDNETHRQYETWNLVDIEAICEKLNEYQNKLDVHILLTDDERRKASNHIKKLEKEIEVLKECLDEADDLIKSHLSSHYNRKWENYCKNKGLNLKELNYEPITKRH